MSRLKFRWIIALLLSVSTGCGGELGERSVQSEGGLYIVRYSPDVDPVPNAILFGLDVLVETAEGEASDVTALEFDATMPAHAHGMQTRPEVESLGNGRFRVEGLKFHMRGRWEMRFNIDGAAGADFAVAEEFAR